jgi:phosphoglucosamine mutase
MDLQARPRFGTDGVRGTYPSTLDAGFVFSLGRAIARVVGTDETYVIGRDTRESGPILFNALSDGLRKEGATIDNVGILPTPGIAMISEKLQRPACVITASHNPAQDNGIKVFNVGGLKVDSVQEQSIERELDDLLVSSTTYEPREEIEKDTSDAPSMYVDYLLNKASRPSLSGLSVVLDCANGASFYIAPTVFKLAGANVHAINTESDGRKINDACGATHLDELQRAVTSYGADIGFAFDGDADRVVAVDSNGTVRDGDTVLALFALDMKEKGKLEHNCVVATTMSNGALRIFLSEHSIGFSETDVGDKYVLEDMMNNNYELGGEQSGHIIRTDCAQWGDGVLNALLIAKILAEKKTMDAETTSASMFELFTPLIQLHDKVTVVNKNSAAGNTDITSEVDRQLQLLGENARVIVRPSGTEEIVRITVEASSEETARNSVAQLREVIEKVCAG